MQTLCRYRRATLAAVLALAASAGTSLVLAHGDVVPQPMDTTGLEALGETWREENPFRKNETAIAIGTSGYNQNCARCHGLEAISGGLAPDLRYLEPGKEGDEVFMERVRNGAVVQGITRMPKFEGTLSQEAMWAIRAYLETKFDG